MVADVHADVVGLNKGLDKGFGTFEYVNNIIAHIGIGCLKLELGVY